MQNKHTQHTRVRVPSTQMYHMRCRVTKFLRVTASVHYEYHTRRVHQGIRAAGVCPPSQPMGLLLFCGHFRILIYVEYFNLCPPRFKYLLRKIPPLEDEFPRAKYRVGSVLRHFGGLVVGVKIRYIDLLRGRAPQVYQGVFSERKVWLCEIVLQITRMS